MFDHIQVDEPGVLYFCKFTCHLLRIVNNHIHKRLLAPNKVQMGLVLPICCFLFAPPTIPVKEYFSYSNTCLLMINSVGRNCRPMVVEMGRTVGPSGLAALSRN